MNKKISRVIGLFLLLVFAALFSVYIYWVYCRGPVTAHDGEYKAQIIVPQGMTIRQVATELKKKNLIHNEFVFYVAARYPWLDKSQMTGLQSTVFHLKAGVYEVSSAMGLSEIFDLLSTGRNADIRVVIPEGLTLRKTAQRLAEAGVCPAAAFIRSAESASLLTGYAIPAGTAEGYLFPDTYFFLPSDTGDQAVRTMLDNFFGHIRQIPSLSDLPAEKLHKVVILASIVEREYRVKTDAPLIASVFTNRLEKHIGLYSCATIEYIITELEGKPHPDVITYDDLHIDSPYNTYKWEGLPPGPISSPGMVALSAAADPPKTHYYYFRLTDPVTGTHSFSTDFRTHVSEGHLLYTKSAAGK